MRTSVKTSLKIASIAFGLSATLFFGLGVGHTISPMTFIVNSTGDGADVLAGDGLCQTLTLGECTLRAAITEANAHANVGGPDTIHFNIPGGGTHTIQPASLLPAITDPVILDGYTQPEASPNTNGPGLGGNAVILIELDGTNTPGGFNGYGLHISSGGSTIRGLAINRFRSRGIFIIGAGGNTIEGNYIGTDPSGTIGYGNLSDPAHFAAGRSRGIHLTGAGGNLVGGTTPAARNVISGHLVPGCGTLECAPGIAIASSGNVIQGNFIGTNPAGTAAVRNINHPDFAFSNATGISGLAGANNTIGGTSPDARNLISGNSVAGIGSPPGLFGGAGTQILGNYIGTDITGTAALANFAGVWLAGVPGTVVGGTAAGAGNLISGNQFSGVNLGSFVGGFVVQGNRIGTQADGVSPLGNSFFGLTLNSDGNKIGGTDAGAGNVIAFSGLHGIGIFGDGNFIQSNSIFSNAGSGISIGLSFLTANGNFIQSNSIFSNSQTGITVISGVGNVIQQNSIFDNAGLGIDLNADGVTPNDARDVDTGPNNLQNFPELTFVNSDGSTTRVRGRLMSTPDTTFTIDFFSNPTCDPSGYGEGKSLIGSAEVTTNPGGIAIFDVTFPAPVAPGQSITATATDSSGNTSEFSQCEEVR